MSIYFSRVAIIFESNNKKRGQFRILGAVLCIFGVKISRFELSSEKSRGGKNEL